MADRTATHIATAIGGQYGDTKVVAPTSHAAESPAVADKPTSAHVLVIFGITGDLARAQKPWTTWTFLDLTTLVHWICESPPSRMTPTKVHRVESLAADKTLTTSELSVDFV
jgi:hypothetical protein